MDGYTVETLFAIDEEDLDEEKTVTPAFFITNVLKLHDLCHELIPIYYDRNAPQMVEKLQETIKLLLHDPLIRDNVHLL